MNTSLTAQPSHVSHDHEYEHRTLAALATARHAAILDLPDEFDDYADVIALAMLEAE